MTHGVQQVRLALPGRPMDKQRIEPHRPALGNGPGSIMGNAVGITDEKIAKVQTRVEAKPRFDGCSHDVIDRCCRKALDDVAVVGEDADPSDFGKCGAPGQIKPVSKILLNPICHESRRQGEGNGSVDLAKPVVAGAT